MHFHRFDSVLAVLVLLLLSLLQRFFLLLKFETIDLVCVSAKVYCLFGVENSELSKQFRMLYKT